MIFHHMADGSVRDSIDGVVIPKNFTNIYELINRRKVAGVDDDGDTGKIVREK